MKVERKCTIVAREEMGDAIYLVLEAGDMVRTSYAGPGQFVHVKCGEGLLLRRPILALFVAGEGADAVVALGCEYLGYMALFYALPALTNGFQGFYRGMGKMTTTLIGTCLQAGLRAALAAVLAPRLGLPGIALACAFGWCVMLAFEVPYYLYICKKRGL